MDVRTTVSFTDKEIRDLLIEKAKESLDRKNLGASEIEIVADGNAVESYNVKSITANVHFKGVQR